MKKIEKMFRVKEYYHIRNQRVRICCNRRAEARSTRVTQLQTPDLLNSSKENLGHVSLPLRFHFMPTSIGFVASTILIESYASTD